jgi:hypothetical protein
MWGCIQVVSPLLALRQPERRYYLCRIARDEQAVCRIQSALTRHNPARGITAPNALGAAWIISAFAPVFHPTTFP